MTGYAKHKEAARILGVSEKEMLALIRDGVIELAAARREFKKKWHR